MGQPPIAGVVTFRFQLEHSCEFPPITLDTVAFASGVQHYQCKITDLIPVPKHPRKTAFGSILSRCICILIWMLMGGRPTPTQKRRKFRLCAVIVNRNVEMCWRALNGSTQFSRFQCCDSTLFNAFRPAARATRLNSPTIPANSPTAR